MDNKNKIIKTRISSIKLRDDGILHIDIKANENFNRKDAEEVVEAAGKIGEGKKFKNLITIGEFTIADIEAIKLACSEQGCKYKLADAFVIHTLSQKFLASIYLNFYSPFCPTKFFRDSTEAIKWLKNHIR